MAHDAAARQFPECSGGRAADTDLDSSGSDNAAHSGRERRILGPCESDGTQEVGEEAARSDQRPAHRTRPGEREERVATSRTWMRGRRPASRRRRTRRCGNQAATAAGDQAKKADDTAMAASGHVDSLNTTVNGLDTYKPISDVEVPFRGGSPVLSKDAKAKLDDMAKSLKGHQGYIIEIEAHSPAAGSAGIASSQREAEAVKRYLVTEHEIPVYRMHSVALGNAQIRNRRGVAAQCSGRSDCAEAAAAHHRERVTSTVHIKLMENSLAAQGTTSPHGMASRPVRSGRNADVATPLRLLPRRRLPRRWPPIKLSKHERTKATWPPLMTGAVFFVGEKLLVTQTKVRSRSFTPLTHITQYLRMGPRRCWLRMTLK